METYDKEAFINNEPGEGLVKWDCPECGCYWWVPDRNKAKCPNCERHRNIRVIK